MYIPPFNRVDDRKKVHAFLEAHGFATVITTNNEGICASHLPVLFDPAFGEHGLLRSHMARANSQWRQLDPKSNVLCVFHGPHAYISPSWYVSQHTVPTWNYAAVHVYGRPRVIAEAAQVREIVRATTDKYEKLVSSRWTIPLSEEEFAGMLRAIVGFEIEITRVEAKFKLGQNRSREDQASMLQALQGAADGGSRELAEFIVRQEERS